MKRKTVVLCGSLRFLPLLQETAERLELEKGYAVIGTIPHVLNRELTEAEKSLLGEIHLHKISLADAIFVVNPGGYIGKIVRAEIEYAKRTGKEIMYLENPKETGG